MSGQPSSPSKSHLATLTVGALGVVYGDIGTSPLYAIRESLAPAHGLAVSPENVLGVLSLIFWALILVISGKYLVFILRADNDGEGGILAMMALVVPEHARGHRRMLLLLGLFGAALLYGDGMLTPAISVLSAVEGIGVATPVLSDVVVPITVVILSILFLVQHHGTKRVGAVFGPVTFVWFVCIATTGVMGIARRPDVLLAIDPTHAVGFLVHGGSSAFMVLGSVFLVVTGGEALYADMGHFGTRPIRIAWFSVALPALLLNYFGQGALLIEDPAAIESPFFRLTPDWALYPMVGIATAATIIASQAVISGAFSLTRQAVQLGYLPRLEIRHTSPSEIGQIYVPVINWILMFATLLVVVGFGSSSRLASAYGVAVTTTMMITTLLFYVVARERWGWPRWRAMALTLAFLIMDVSFFGANIVKIADGGWLPLAVAIGGFLVMTTWWRGRATLYRQTREQHTSLASFVASIHAHPLPRVPGSAIFLSADPDGTPSPLLHNLKHNKVLHESVFIVTVEIRDNPRVSARQRVAVEALSEGFVRVRVCYGFLETPNLWQTLREARDVLPGLDPMKTTFFVGRTRPVPGRRPSRWRERLFAAMAVNARDASVFFGLPPNLVVELGSQVELSFDPHAA